MSLDINSNLNLDECNKDVDCVVDMNTNVEADINVLEPFFGIEFNTHQDAYTFYLKYATYIGFGISRMHSRRSKTSKEFIDIKFACTRYGKKRESSASNQRPCLKLNCKIMLHVKQKLEGKWYVHSFINHGVS